MKRQRWWILVVAVTCLAVGVLLGGLLARRNAQATFREFSEVLSSYIESSGKLRTFEAQRDLETLQALRDDRIADAIRYLEDQVEAHLDYLSNRDVESERAAELIAEIRAYRDQYPWQPRLPEEPHSPAGLFASARILPVFESGTMIGIRVSRIMPGSFWDQAGIQEGDIIVQVDDVAIGSPESSARAFRILSSEPSFEVDRSDPNRVRLRSSTP